MNDKHNPHRPTRTLLLVHGFLYTILWAMALYYVAFGRPDLMLFGQNRIVPALFWLPLPALLWLPILIIHIGIYFRAKETVSSVGDEHVGYRAGYRDGYQDGIKGSRYDASAEERLALGENGELVEWQPESKRKRS